MTMNLGQDYFQHTTESQKSRFAHVRNSVTSRDGNNRNHNGFNLQIKDS